MHNAIIPFHLCQCRLSVEIRNLDLFELFGQLANQMQKNQVFYHLLVVLADTFFLGQWQKWGDVVSADAADVHL